MNYVKLLCFAPRRFWLVILGLLWTLGGCAAGANSDTAPALPATDDAQNAARVTIGNRVTQGLPAIPEALVQDMQRYRNTRRAAFAGFAGDAMFITTRFGQTNQLHRVAGPGKSRQQITFFSEPIREVALPKGLGAKRAQAPTELVFTKDVGGSEFFQLFALDAASGDSRMLSDGKSRYTGVRFATSGEQFAYTSTERDGVHFDIYVRTIDSAPRRVVTGENGIWQTLDWSPDNAKLLAVQYLSRNLTYLYEVDVATGTKTLIAGADNQTFIGAAVYGRERHQVYFQSDRGREFGTLYLLDTRTGEREALTTDIPWSVEDMVLSPARDRLAFSVNHAGMSKLYLLDTTTGSRQALPGVPTGIIYGMEFSPDSADLALTLGRPTRPTDVYVLDLKTTELHQWTFSEVGGLDVDTFVEPELVSFHSFNDDQNKTHEVPAFVYTPKGPGPHPVLVLIHGGPEGQYRPSFSATIQYYVNELGLAVIAPNVRGSAGYGKTFLKLDNGMRREDSVKDIGALLDWVAGQPQLNASKVVVYGGSYGGYMVLASMVHYADRIAAGIDVVGISDFVTFLENTQAYRQDLRRAEYGDERDPAMRRYLEKIAPLRQVDKIRKPLFVAQGLNDPRVPASESEQIVSALSARDVPVWYLLFNDEGHGFRKKANSDLASAAYVLFLQQFVLGER